MHGISSENDSKLFTPGPLTTSLTVKQSMLHDLGSRDTVFINIVAHIRAKILNLASKDHSMDRFQSILFDLDASPDEYTVVLVQGSGTYAVEATFSTSVPRTDAKVTDLSSSTKVLHGFLSYLTRF